MGGMLFSVQGHDNSSMHANFVTSNLKRNIVCNQVYENEHALSFLDINPISEGHTLVIPKKHYVKLDEMPPELAGAVGAATSKVARAVVSAGNKAHYNILQVWYNLGRLWPSFHSRPS